MRIHHQTGGRAIVDVSDPNLAGSHKKGAKVMWVQPCLNDQFGKIMYTWPNFWVLDFRIAERASRRLEKYERRLLDIEISNSNDRHVNDIKLIEDFYRSGFELVVHTYLSFEHLTLAIIRGVYRNDFDIRNNLQDKELKDKLNHVLKKIFKSPELINSDGYVRLFSEFEIKRHTFNHPLEDNVYNADQNNWNNVPLAWIFAGKYKRGFNEISKLFVEISKKWDKYQKDNDKPTKVHLIKGGIRSTHPVKKPPRY